LTNELVLYKLLITPVEKYNKGIKILDLLT